MKKIIELEETKEYYNTKTETYEFIDENNNLIDIDIREIAADEYVKNYWFINSNIICGDIIAYDLRVKKLNAQNIEVKNLNAVDVKTYDINAQHVVVRNELNAHEINAKYIRAHKIITDGYITAVTISGDEIISRDNIKADIIDYYRVCCSYSGRIICNSIFGGIVQQNILSPHCLEIKNNQTKTEEEKEEKQKEGKQWI